jgi:ammonium transporter, Amt family
LFIVGYNIFITSFLCVVIKYVFRVPLRMSEEMLLIGDDAVHGEDAYTFNDFLEPEDPPRVRDIETGNVIPAESGSNGGENGQESFKKQG